MNATFNQKTIDPKDGVEDRLAILAVRGALDHTSYCELIQRTRSLYENGHRRLVLDLSEVVSVGLSGLFALLSTAVTYNGKTPADPVGGLRALHELADVVAVDSSPNFKLFNPQPGVAEALRPSRLPVFENLSAAVESFYSFAGRSIFEHAPVAG